MSALTNDGSFVVNGSSGMATMTGLTNNAGGFIDVDKGATMTVNGNVTNNASGPQGIYTGFNGTGGKHHPDQRYTHQQRHDRP